MHGVRTNAAKSSKSPRGKYRVRYPPKDASCGAFSSATGQMIARLAAAAFPLMKDNRINEREAVEPNDNTAIKRGLAKARTASAEQFPFF